MAEKYSKSIERKLKLAGKAKILLIIGGLFTIASGLSGTFANTYLWKAEKTL